MKGETEYVWIATRDRHYSRHRPQCRAFRSHGAAIRSVVRHKLADARRDAAVETEATGTVSDGDPVMVYQRWGYGIMEYTVERFEVHG